MLGSDGEFKLRVEGWYLIIGIRLHALAPLMLCATTLLAQACLIYVNQVGVHAQSSSTLAFEFAYGSPPWCCSLLHQHLSYYDICMNLLQEIFLAAFYFLLLSERKPWLSFAFNTWLSVQ